MKEAPSSGALSKEIRKVVAKELKGEKNELAVWDLADDGWKSVLRARLTRMRAERARSLNTPKAAQLTKLFSDTLGVNDITVAWTWKGMSSKKAQQTQVEDFLNHVERLVEKTERRVDNHVKDTISKTP